PARPPARWSQSGSGRDPDPKRSRRGSLDDIGGRADRHQLRSHALQSAHLEPKWASVSQQPLRRTIRTRPVISLSMPWLFLPCLVSSLAKTLTVRRLFRWNFGSTLFVRRASKATR